MSRKEYSEAETQRMQKHLRRLARALTPSPGKLYADKVKPERLAEFEQVMKARHKHAPSGKQVAYGLMHQANEFAMNRLNWRDFDKSRKTKKVRESVKRKLGIK